MILESQREYVQLLVLESGDPQLAFLTAGPGPAGA